MTGISSAIVPELSDDATARRLPGFIVPFFGTRLLLTLVGLWSANRWVSPTPSLEAPHLSDWKLLNLWSHFDGAWYMDLTLHGYRLTTDQPPNVGFMPLMSGLMALLAWPMGGGANDVLIAGLLISNGALLLALFYLRKLIELDNSETVADRALLYILVFPTTLFLSAVHSMSLFLCIAVAGIYHARRGRFALASCVAALAPLARPDGLLLGLPLLVEWIHQRYRPLPGIPRPELRQLIWLGLIPLTLASWMGYLHSRFGDALAFVHVQRWWLESGWSVIVRALATRLHAWAILAMAVLIVLTLARSVTRIRPSYTTYFAAYAAMMLFSGRLWSMPRFALVLFPMYLTLAQLTHRPRVHRVVVGTGVALSLAVMFRYAAFYFVG